jgi:hypothetical protein
MVKIILVIFSLHIYHVRVWILRFILDGFIIQEIN